RLFSSMGRARSSRGNYASVEMLHEIGSSTASLELSCESWRVVSSVGGLRSLLPAGAGGSESSTPSAMLEQEAHTFGFRERALPCGDIGSPQQRQIRGFILSSRIKIYSFSRTRAEFQAPQRLKPSLAHPFSSKKKKPTESNSRLLTLISRHAFTFL